jgi:hypothetical protein
MKIRDVPQTGALGETVAYQSRYGLIRRRKVIPRDPRTPLQVDRRAAMRRAAAFWGTLTDEQRAAWNVLAQGRRTRAVLGQSGPISGYLLSVKLNCNVAAIGLPMMADPPSVPAFPLNPVARLIITNAGGATALKLRLSASPVHCLVVLGAKPQGPGVSYVDHYTILGVTPAPDGDLCDITALYVAKYGVPRPGKRIFIQTIQQINGWQDLPKPTTALVPAA